MEDFVQIQHTEKMLERAYSQITTEPEVFQGPRSTSPQKGSFEGSLDKVSRSGVFTRSLLQH